MIQNRSGQKLKNIQTIRSDNGGEYTSNEFKAYCKQMGIVHEYTNPYTLEQNGVSEQYNRRMLEQCYCMLHSLYLFGLKQ